MYPSRSQRGSTLIEVVVVAFIVVIALVALANLTMVSLSRNRQAKELAVATRLAQEGLEWFKDQRNNLGYDEFSTISSVMEIGLWCVNQSAAFGLGSSSSTTPWTDTSCVVGASSDYHRWFSVDVPPEDPEYVQVTVYVAAPGDVEADAISAEGKIYEWQR